MATKNIAISEEAYNRLKSMRRSGESFTDVINRITKSRSILELTGLLSAEEAKGVASTIAKVRSESSLKVRGSTPRTQR
jgi:predicted CopG family antitoxin